MHSPIARRSCCASRSSWITTLIKIDSAHAPRGPGGQKYLASGNRVAMRLWERETEGSAIETHHDYEVVGYVLRGRAELYVEGLRVMLGPGDSYLVPRGARHFYKIGEPFTAVEAISPPSFIHARDEGDDGRTEDTTGHSERARVPARGCRAARLQRLFVGPLEKVE